MRVRWPSILAFLLVPGAGQAKELFFLLGRMEALNASESSASNFNWQPGKTDEAAAHFRQALRLRPDYAEAKSNLEAAIQMYRREAKWKSANFHQKIETAGKETG